MEAVKIVMIAYAIISPIHSRYSPKKISYKDPNVFKNNCICYPEGQGHTTVTELIDPYNNGLERLVIYIYKDVNTNDMKMYIPNREKQNAIPDVAFDLGDSLTTVSKDTTFQVFNHNPNIVKVKANTANPIGMNTGLDDIVTLTVPNANVNTVNGPSPPKASQDGYNDNHNIWQRFEKKNNWNIDPELPNDFYEFVNLYKPNESIKHGADIFRREMQDINFPNGNKRYLTFDRWFTEQMSRFHNVNLPGDINLINSAALRYLVQTILQQNNMYVTTEGLLIDAHGMALDVSNLELRPMLLGNAVQYLTTSEKLTLPKHLPYLEGILVTLVYPPKVLGIIPLGKTYLSQTSAIKGVVATPITVTGTKELKATKQTIPGMTSNQEPLKVEFNQKAVPAVTVNEIPEKPRRVVKEGSKASVMKQDAPTKVIVKTFKNQDDKNSKTKSKPGYRSEDWNGIDRSDEVTDISSLFENESRKLPVVGEVIERLMALLEDSKRRKSDHSVEDYEDEYKYRGQMPGFRIIGGNPATSSGAPVSNKGRSGEHNDSI